MERRALNYYTNAADGLGEFDKLFAANATDTLTYFTWLSQMPDGTAFTNRVVSVVPSNMPQPWRNGRQLHPQRRRTA